MSYNKNYERENGKNAGDGYRGNRDNRDNRDNRENRDNRDNNRDNRDNRDNRNKRNNKYNNDEMMSNEEKEDTMLYYDYAKNDPNMVEIDNVMISKELIPVFNRTMKHFDELNEPNGLKETLLKAIYNYGFEKPSEIQKNTVQQIINGRDILVQSQSGTGKTGAFVIGVLQTIDETKNYPQAILLSNTHELAAQTLNVIYALSEFMNINISFTVGDVDLEKNILELNNGEKTSKIIIATPGRLKHMITINPKFFEKIKIFVIDECDELLGYFKDDLRYIYTKLPSDMQTCLFSATLNSSIVDLSSRILRDPLKILIKKENMTLDGIIQTEIKVNDEREKFNVLLELLSSINIEQFIIYVNSKKEANFLKQELMDNGYTAVSINSDNSKVERNEILKAFKKGEFKCLISTDLLSRGIDIPQLYLVINYELPRKDNIESYIHRIGRSGRYGKKGLAINFNMSRFDQDITTLIQITFECSIYPFTEEILNKYLKH
jgi:superfamily II DNA/RNA helicase